MKKMSSSPNIICAKKPFMLIAIIFLTVSLVSKTLHDQLDWTESPGRIEQISITSNCNGLKGGNCAKVNKRLSQYCSINVPMTNREGPTFQGHEEYKLEYILLTIRHGDRSSIHQMPGSDTDSHLDSPLRLYDERAKEYIPRVSSFSIVPILPKTYKQPHANFLPNSLAHEALFATADSLLPQGQLTTQGFMQHIQLGEALSRSYHQFLVDITSKKDISIRSTNYNRTIQSVAALVMSMVPNIGGPNPTDQIQINSFPDEYDEVMHGVGLKLSSHHVNANGETAVLGSCKKAAEFAMQQQTAFQTKQRIMKSLHDTFGGGVNGRVITDLVDAALPKHCHSEPLPCRTDSTVKKCLTTEMLGEMLFEADRAFCERYTGSDGGFNGTMLSIYPFMTEILDNLKKAASGRNVKLGIFSGHDTVIAPVLAGLGVFKDMCQWPPLASRIAFELWKPNSSSSSKGRRPQAGGSLMPGPDDSYVRIIFNGVDVTQMIPACKRAADSVLSRSASISATDSRSSSGGYAQSETGAAVAQVTQGKDPALQTLCPLVALEEQIKSMLGPFKNMEKACS